MSELSEYDFCISSESIAQYPNEIRRNSKLMFIDRTSGRRAHHRFCDLPELLTEGDLVVRNVSSVRPSRLRGHKETGGKIEILLLGSGEVVGTFRALVKTKGKLRPGIAFTLSEQLDGSGIEGTVREVLSHGEILLSLETEDPYAFGEIPLPHYIRNGVSEPIDYDRYQTTYAEVPGSVAAPTAGLHFDNVLDRQLRKVGVVIENVVLHVGAGTFRPVTSNNLEENILHEEVFDLPSRTCEAIQETKARGGKIIAVGTTTCRVLETCGRQGQRLLPQSGKTNLFLKPGDAFNIVDGLLTNFHLPRSSLLLLVAAFAGKTETLSAYREAIEKNYQFYSYGDAMLIL